MNGFFVCPGSFFFCPDGFYSFPDGFYFFPDGLYFFPDSFYFCPTVFFCCPAAWAPPAPPPLPPSPSHPPRWPGPGRARAGPGPGLGRALVSLLICRAAPNACKIQHFRAVTRLQKHTRPPPPSCACRPQHLKVVRCTTHLHVREGASRRQKLVKYSTFARSPDLTNIHNSPIPRPPRTQLHVC